ncbi:tRNA (5-methylaminomethyl-2-thiouridine)(34)-methyltransferase MnmD [Kerstersia sp.]|uniref:tRNA (5-methylaminomethyl-2-thiouridine)(34)-methyltransferase MnmD n=1 Tax=Kerstersia sp. TaxID=1930783 RepID=UPI003F8E9600
MSSSYQALKPAQPDLDSSGLPYSTDYGDIYHAAQGSLAQARHVFLSGNRLPQRWAGRERFVVCETGFGLGGNFLALWQAWRADPERCRRLHVVSLEAHPFTRAGLASMWRASLALELRALADTLLAQWPEPLPGLHRLEFEGGALTLTLGFGEALTLAPRLEARVDAYFFDGFAPARNPEMWSAHLFRRLARMAAPDATLATWCSAGHVRRAMEDAGFLVERWPGLNGKRHMVAGVRRALRTPGKAVLPQAYPGPRTALIIGGGPAGAGMAQALTLRGWQAVVVDPAPVRAGGVHQGHAAAASVPLIARDDNPRARLARAGNLRSWARWSGLAGDAAPLRCGALQMQRPDGRAGDPREALAELAFPSSWVRWMDRDEASQHAGLSLSQGGVYFSSGMLVKPPELLGALLRTPGVTHIQASVAGLRHGAAGWQALGHDGQILAEGAVLVMAGAGASWPLLQQAGLDGREVPRLAALQATGGAIASWPAARLHGGPACVLGAEGYLLPALAGRCVVGSTYEEGGEAWDTQARRCAMAEKMPAMLADAALGRANGTEAWWGGDWSGWRAVVPGRLPVFGPLPQLPDAWVATAFGSRGFSWAALAGDVLAATLEGEPLPLERDLLEIVKP